MSIPLSLGKSFKTLNSSELNESRRDFSETKSGTDLNDAIFSVVVKSFSLESLGASDGGKPIKSSPQISTSNLEVQLQADTIQCN
jgi:hypothetical protein